MKKQYFLLGLFASLSLFGQENIIVNSGFEERTVPSSPADSWITGTTTAVDQNSRQKHSGTYSLRMTSQRGSGWYTPNIYQTGEFDVDLWDTTKHEVKPNQAYELSYWVLDNVTKAQLRHEVKWKDESENLIKTSTDELVAPKTSSKNSEEWVQYSFVGTAPADAKYVEIWFYTDKENDEFGESVYLDDVVFRETDKMSVNNVELAKTIKLSNTVVKTDFRIIGIDKGTLELYSTDGRKVQSGKFTAQSSINISGLAKGIYILKIETEKGVVTKKIIKE
ncbi:MAG: T9SS type A sorting domain-containing protein [Cruoricaptor ignavus]|nr:T9SS type A sorting domain-containing protein [Cruoricaptor ignavus]